MSFSFQIVQFFEERKGFFVAFFVLKSYVKQSKMEARAETGYTIQHLQPTHGIRYTKRRSPVNS